MKKIIFLSLLVVSLTSLLPLFGNSQILVPDDNIPGVMISQGYNIELGIDGLNYPSNITVGNGKIWITEAGFPGVPPTVKEITLNGTSPGTATIILTPAMLPPGMLLPPFTDITFKDGLIWLSHRQVGANGWGLGAVSRFNPANPASTFQTVIANLPSAGDHHTNTIEFAPNGRGYVSIGSATNSGVVGADNVPKWVEDAPGFRDMAPVNITFAPNGFTARVPTSLDPDSNAVTAAYRAFDTGAETSDYMVAAATPSNPQDGVIAGVGAVYSFDPSAADVAASLVLECWGLRNPFGLAFDASDPSRLFISNNGSDIRGKAGDPNDPLNPATFVLVGNRPISNDRDDMFEITVGGAVEFFGWPDYFHDPVTNAPLSVANPLFCNSPVLTAADCPQPLFAPSFANTLVVKDAFASVGQFVSVTGFAPSTSTQFGFVNNLFVTESGSFSPQTGAFTFTGYKVSRFDHITGAKSDFVVNSGSTPEELFVPEKMNKPVSTIFMGDTMLIVDLGVLEPGLNIFEPGTGKVWMVINTAVGINVTLDPFNPLCVNASTFTLTGGMPAGGVYSGTGVANGMFNPSVAGVGSHTITYSLNGQSATQTITVYPLPVVTLSASGGTKGCDNTIIIGYNNIPTVITATSTTAISYQWYHNGNLISGASGSTLNIAQGGNYSVIVTDANGCMSDPNAPGATININDVSCGNNKVLLCHNPPGKNSNPKTLCISRNAVSAHLANHPGDCLGACPGAKLSAPIIETVHYHIAPNPFTNKAKLSFMIYQDGVVKIEMLDIMGRIIKIVLEKSVKGHVEHQVEINAEGIKAGIYFLRMQSPDGVVTKQLNVVK